MLVVLSLSTTLVRSSLPACSECCWLKTCALAGNCHGRNTTSPLFRNALAVLGFSWRTRQAAGDGNGNTGGNWPSNLRATVAGSRQAERERQYSNRDRPGILRGSGLASR